MDRLLFPSTINLVSNLSRTIHGAINVRSSLSIRITNDASNHLNRQTIQARRAFLINVRSDCRQRLQRIRSLARRISARRRVMSAFPRFIRSFSALRYFRITISVDTTSAIIRRMFHRFFYRTLNRNDSGRALLPFSTLLGLFRRIICLIRTKACIGRQIRRSHEAGRLFRCSAFALLRFMFYQDNARMGRLLNRLLRLFRYGQAIIRNNQRARSMFRRVYLTNAIATMRNPSLQCTSIAFVSSGRGVFERRVGRAMKANTQFTSIRMA